MFNIQHLFTMCLQVLGQDYNMILMITLYFVTSNADLNSFNFGLAYIMLSIPSLIMMVFYYGFQISKIFRINDFVFSWRQYELMFVGIFWACSCVAFVFALKYDNIHFVLITWYGSSWLMYSLVDRIIARKKIRFERLFWEVVAFTAGILVHFADSSSVYDPQNSVHAKNALLAVVSKLCWCVSKILYVKYLLKFGMFKKQDGFFLKLINESHDITKLRADSNISKQSHYNQEYMEQEKEYEGQTLDHLRDKIKGELVKEKFNHKIDLQSFTLTFDEIGINDPYNNNFTRNNKQTRQEMLNSYIESQGQNIMHTLDILNLQKYVLYMTNLAVVEAKVGKCHKYEYFRFRINKNQVKKEQNQLTNEDLVEEIFDDLYQTLKQVHYFTDNVEVRLLKLDKMVDYPQFEQVIVGIDFHTTLNLSLVTNGILFTLCIICLNLFYPRDYVEAVGNLSDTSNALFYILIIYSFFYPIRNYLMFNSLMELKVEDTTYCYDFTCFIYIAVYMLANRNIFVNGWMVPLIALVVLASYVVHNIKYEYIMKGYLDSLLQLLHVHLPFTNKDQEWPRILDYVKKLNEKCGYKEVYNHLFNIMISNSLDSMFICQPYYLKYRSNANIFHKRTIKNWGMMYPRPMGEYISRSYLLTNRSKFMNIIQGRGVPLSFGWWVKAKHSIDKKMERLMLEHPLGENEFVDLIDFDFNNMNTDMLGDIWTKIENRNIRSLELKRKIAMTQPIPSGDVAEVGDEVENLNEVDNNEHDPEQAHEVHDPDTFQDQFQEQDPDLDDHDNHGMHGNMGGHMGGQLSHINEDIHNYSEDEHENYDQGDKFEEEDYMYKPKTTNLRDNHSSSKQLLHNNIILSGSNKLIGNHTDNNTSDNQWNNQNNSNNSNEKFDEFNKFNTQSQPQLNQQPSNNTNDKLDNKQSSSSLIVKNKTSNNRLDSTYSNPNIDREQTVSKDKKGVDIDDIRVDIDKTEEKKNLRNFLDDDDLEINMKSLDDLKTRKNFKFDFLM